MTMRPVFIVKILIYLTWVFGKFPGTFAQDLSGAVNSTIGFLDSGLTSLGHVSAFVNAVVRGRMDCETGCREILCKLESNWSLRRRQTLEDTYANKDVLAVAGIGNESRSLNFLCHVGELYGVCPVLLSGRMYKTMLDDPKVCKEEGDDESHCTCLCISSSRSEMAIRRLVEVLPGTVFRDKNHNHVLLCALCIEGGCHSFALGPFHCIGEELEQGDPASFPAAFMAGLCVEDEEGFTKGELCICVPLKPVSTDNWTKALRRMVRTKDEADRGSESHVTKVLDEYMSGSTATGIGSASFDLAETMLPRLVEVALILILSFWFRVDGFSSSLVARRAMRDYVTHENGNATHIGLWVREVVVWNATDSYEHTSHVLKLRKGSLDKATLMLAVVTTASVLGTAWWCFFRIEWDLDWQLLIRLLQSPGDYKDVGECRGNLGLLLLGLHPFVEVSELQQIPDFEKPAATAAPTSLDACRDRHGSADIISDDRRPHGEQVDLRRARSAKLGEMVVWELRTGEPGHGRNTREWEMGLCFRLLLSRSHGRNRWELEVSSEHTQSFKPLLRHFSKVFTQRERFSKSGLVGVVCCLLV